MKKSKVPMKYGKNANVVTSRAKTHSMGKKSGGKKHKPLKY